MRPLVFSACLLALVVAGCAQAPALPRAADDATRQDGADRFHVPPLHVGDRFQYHFTFDNGEDQFEGATQLTVEGLVNAKDGYGRVRESLHLRQGTPDGGFGEDYFVDARTFQQFRLLRPDQYNETSSMPPPPLAPLPVRGKSYANATGFRERHLEDPLFEDANFFGIFATDRDLPSTGEFGIDGRFWQRDGTRLLAAGNWTGPVSVPPADESWGALREVAFTATHDEGERDREEMAWRGRFAATVPLAIEAERTIGANFFGDEINVRFNATLLAYTPGDGQALPRGTAETLPPATAGVRAEWGRAPVDGAGEKLPFPLSEALAALEKDPTAIQYFQSHPGAYLYVAEMYDIDTCGFLPGARPPGCHWLQWDGLFFAPDDFILSFIVEKYASDDGTGVAYVPAVPREYVFDTLIDTVLGGEPFEPPTASVAATKINADLGPRDQFPKDALTVSSVIQLWKGRASPANLNLRPNSFFLHLGSSGYTFEIAHIQWEFPPNPELSALHDNLPFELERHGTDVEADGLVAEDRNYEIVVTHR